MPSYKELNRLPAEAFQNWENFKTENDLYPVRAAQQYQDGLAARDKYSEVSVSANGTWCATGKDGSSITSYEGIGYHSHTAELWAGFLDSGCPLYVFRRGDDGQIRRFSIFRKAAL